MRSSPSGMRASVRCPQRLQYSMGAPGSACLGQARTGSRLRARAVRELAYVQARAMHLERSAIGALIARNQAAPRHAIHAGFGVFDLRICFAAAEIARRAATYVGGHIRAR